MHIVNWRTVCKDKRNGGFNIRKLDVLNKALVGKWLCRHDLEHNSLSRRIIEDKYEEVTEGGTL